METALALAVAITAGWLLYRDSRMARRGAPADDGGAKRLARARAQWKPGTAATPHQAAQADDLPALRRMAANGADPLLVPNNGLTSLMVAAGAGWTIRSSNRRDQGIGIDAAQLLVSNSERSTWEATRLALELGGDVHATDPAGNTALHAAVTLAYPTVVELLVEHGAKLDMENKAGASAEDLACRDAAGKLVRRPGGRGPCPGTAGQ